jgi:polysaccharide deacetylase family protein (PEP-CTERM system associated)
MLLVNTFDVEPWWTTVPPSINRSAWDDMPDRGNSDLNIYMDLCDAAGVKCTFFFVGWYAKKFPERVREVLRRGHEVGCHSMFHDDVAAMDVSTFELDSRNAKAMIEDVGGVNVVSYRAPSFSFPPERCKELLGVLASLGYLIDSSITTATRVYGGGHDKKIFRGPFSLYKTFGIDIFEIPAPGVGFFGKDFQVFGGGYLRLTPLLLLRYFLANEDYQVLYLHPHDFDKKLPSLPGENFISNLRRRVRIGRLESKVMEIFKNSKVQSCGQIYQSHRNQICIQDI